ncbi:MAG: hypothetical protein COA62_08165 [Rhodobiaceae bacterium]|nr:MAG: hypothetical protein COA62_08165 [Rhodobiaceae bacterium]
MIARWYSTLRHLSFEQALLGGTILLLAWAPLPLGSNRLWSESLLSLGVALLLVGCTANAWRKGGFGISPDRIAVPAALFGVAIVWVFVQWTPYTPAFLHHPIWAMASGALETEIPGRITANPAATLTSAAGLLGYAGLFWVSLQLSASRRRALTLVKAIALIGGFYAWYGIVAFLLGNSTILIYEKWEYLDSLTSTFVNRNSFATYAGIGLICSLSVLLRSTMPIFHSSARTRVKLSQAAEIIFKNHLIYLVAGIGLFAALMLSASRAGIASSFLGLGVLIVLMIRSQRLARHRLIKISSVTLGSFLLAALPFSGLVSERLERVDTSLSENARIEVYRLTLAAISDAPLVGTGLGSFGDIFPYYRDTEVFSPSSWVKAHNTYLETILELGIPAGFSLILSIGILSWMCFREALRRRRFRATPAAAAGAAVLVGLHSGIDFSLQIPAVAATFASLLGASIGLCSHLNTIKAEEQKTVKIDRDPLRQAAGQSL